MSFSDFFRRAHPKSNNVTIAFDTVFDPPLVGIWVGVAGDIELELTGSVGNSEVYKGVAAGTYMAFPIRQIVAAGTVTIVAGDVIGHI